MRRVPTDARTEVLEPLRVVRRARQRPARALRKNITDKSFVHKQADLLERVGLIFSQLRTSSKDTQPMPVGSRPSTWTARGTGSSKFSFLDVGSWGPVRLGRYFRAALPSRACRAYRKAVVSMPSPTVAKHGIRVNTIVPRTHRNPGRHRRPRLAVIRTRSGQGLRGGRHKELTP
jgi:hypothetical protein